MYILFHKFSKEITEFEQYVSQITSNKQKKEFETLLFEFKKLAKVIDDNHSTEYNGYIKPVMLKDTISAMVEIRTKFYKLKKDLLNSA